MDVSRDGETTAIDALQIINRLVRQGSASVLPNRTPVDLQEGYFDVNVDGKATALDALQVINLLSRQQQLAEPERVDAVWAMPSRTLESDVMNSLHELPMIDSMEAAVIKSPKIGFTPERERAKNSASHQTDQEEQSLHVACAAIDEHLGSIEDHKLESQVDTGGEGAV